MILYPKIICTYIRPTSSREVGKNNNPNKTECTRHRERTCQQSAITEYSEAELRVKIRSFSHSMPCIETDRRAF